MFIKSTSLIIPTKDRISSLKKLFFSIKDYISKFDEILIIDSSEKFIHESLIEDFKLYKNLKIFKSEPSSSIQRNIGIKKSNKNNKFIMFCDDDIIFEKNSFEFMSKHIEKFSSHAGYGFNLIEQQKTNFFDYLKRNRIFTKNGLYDIKPGRVCENGWHTKIFNLKEDLETMWLSTQTCIFRSNYIDEKTYFNLNLGNYSYLEDLFFSFEIGKKGKLSCCSKATYIHPNNIERISYKFGIKEIVNRYKFVKKNKLNLTKFYVTAFLKSLSNLTKIFSIKFNSLPKFLGNISGIILCIIKQKK
jgi:hypothetical protein